MTNSVMSIFTSDLAFTFRKVFNIPIWPEFIKSIIQKDKTSIFLREGFSNFSFTFLLRG